MSKPSYRVSLPENGGEPLDLEGVDYSSEGHVIYELRGGFTWKELLTVSRELAMREYRRETEGREITAQEFAQAQRLEAEFEEVGEQDSEEFIAEDDGEE